MAWQDYINDFIKFWDNIISMFKAKPKTLKDIGVKAEISFLTPDGIITKDVSDKMEVINTEDGKITFVNSKDIVFPPAIKSEWRTVVGVQLIDGTKMRSELDKK